MDPDPGLRSTLTLIRGQLTKFFAFSDEIKQKNFTWFWKLQLIEARNPGSDQNSKLYKIPYWPCYKWLTPDCPVSLWYEVNWHKFSAFSDFSLMSRTQALSNYLKLFKKKRKKFPMVLETADFWGSEPGSGSKLFTEYWPCYKRLKTNVCAWPVSLSSSALSFLAFTVLWYEVNWHKLSHFPFFPHAQNTIFIKLFKIVQIKKNFLRFCKMWHCEPRNPGPGSKLFIEYWPRYKWLKTNALAWLTCEPLCISPKLLGLNFDMRSTDINFRIFRLFL